MFEGRPRNAAGRATEVRTLPAIAGIVLRPGDRGDAIIDLQQRFAASQHHIGRAGLAGGPLRRDMACQLGRFAEGAAQRAIGANKVGIAKAADRLGPVLLAAVPEVAAGKAAEHGRPAGLQAFALQRVEDFLDLVGHDNA